MPKQKKNDPLNPSPALLSKLGSIVVHVEEMLSPSGHTFDKIAMEQCLADGEVRQWIKDMGPMLPLKR